MKIDRISIFALDLPLTDNVYAWSGGNSIWSYDTTIVRLDTDEGLTGWGEVSPLGAFYLPAYADGARRGLMELAPHLLGANPLQLASVNRRMDLAMKGHPYVKSPVDIACWDLLGKASGLPVCDLLGGRFGDGMPVYWSVSQDTPEKMVETMCRIRESGIKGWQIKVGGDEATDIQRVTKAAEAFPGDLFIADGNTGWLPHQARRVVKAVEHLDIALEQPCVTYENCRQIRDSTKLPFVLDESVENIEFLVRAISERSLDVLNIKIGKFGGLTKAKAMRDLCVATGLAVTIDDLPGGDLTGATILHLAQSTPEAHRFAVTASYLKTHVHFAEGGPVVERGLACANQDPGLGVRPDEAMLGTPIFQLTD